MKRKCRWVSRLFSIIAIICVSMIVFVDQTNDNWLIFTICLCICSVISAILAIILNDIRYSSSVIFTAMIYILAGLHVVFHRFAELNAACYTTIKHCNGFRDCIDKYQMTKKDKKG